MGFNPMKLAHVSPLWRRFKTEHKDFLDDVKLAGKACIFEGSTIEITITTPEGESRSAKVTLSENDMEFFAGLKSLFS